MDSVREECQDDITKYETTYEKYKEIGEQLQASSTWKTFLVGGQSFTVDESALAKYDPQHMRFFAGNSFTNLIFSKQDVETFFGSRLNH